MTREQALRAAALAVLRADAMIGAHDDHPATHSAQTAHDRIMGVTVSDMPADPDMIGVLLETLSQRLGGVSRADCWRHIGVNPNRGRDLLARSANALDWPIFFRNGTLLDLKFDHAIDLASRPGAHRRSTPAPPPPPPERERGQSVNERAGG